MAMKKETIKGIAQLVRDLEIRGDYSQNMKQRRRELQDELIRFRRDGSPAYRLPQGSTVNLDIAIESWASA